VRVLVTGATGFVGSHLVEALLARGDDVVGLIRSPTKAARVFTERKPEVVEGDLGNHAALRRAADGADAVFHAAALTSARTRAEFFAANVTGTQHVLDAVRDAAPRLHRLVYVSSIAAAGPSSRGMPVTEDAEPRPVSDYGASKLAGEQAVRQSGLPWTVVRPPAVYGPRDVELRRVFSFARWRVAPVFGDGRQELSLIHVEDLVSALLAALDRGRPEGTYFAAHPEVVTSAEFVAAVGRAVTEVLHGRARDPRLVLRIPFGVARAALTINGAVLHALGRSTVLSADKIPELLAEAWTCSAAALERDTGWRAAIGTVDGLRSTAAWYRDAGWL
jgi:nucleoside-diphosphate-sugar epimerase